MGRKIKKLCFAIILVTLLTGLTGCYDAREVDDLAYPMAIGFDKGEDNLLKMTLQLALPVNIAGGEGGVGGEGDASSIVTLEVPAIYSGLNMANTFISKQINLSHAKAIVFSEELARDGIDKYVTAISRGREFRPSTFVVIATGSAEEYIRAVEPALEGNPAKYYEMKMRAFEYTGFTADTRFLKFYNNLKCTSSQGYVALASISDFEKSDEIDNEKSTYIEKGREVPLEGDFKAGGMPKTGDVKSEIMGLAVFDGAKMVGVLDGAETMSHLMVKGDFNYAFSTLPDPLKEGHFVLLSMSQGREPRNSVELVNDTPNISVNVILEGDIQSIQSGINYEEKENLKILEKSIEKFFEEEITRYLEKTIKVYGVDIVGFGQLMKRKFVAWDEWEDFNWLNKYKESTFDVNVDVKIRRPGIMLRTVQVPNSKEE
ncbi:Ger(x)C family spore germination protein [Herbivorax sp. ANBcel31]|uniref:Ger(x)C family spore germination protein n=1 Tax=Herbivorax sp. ANBcel31 TaxID=3069754 RepID=UPI0027B780FB|nr:Ger(x)C family spore germination protein [Herbivorax sp. ANBcel31]MDQ2086184.1 Ger(x)C family spore germination protein [Herbivorax sp. ANBcel31]